MGLFGKKPPKLRRDRAMEILSARNNSDLRFTEATDEVVGGLSLEATGNRFHRPDVYVATSQPPKVDLMLLRTGVTLKVGGRESMARRELRCLRSGDEVTVAVYDAEGSPLTRVLAYRTPEDEVDEGLLTWFGPAEDYGTPWSDSSPAVCQVVTVERLRRWALEAK